MKCDTQLLAWTVTQIGAISRETSGSNVRIAMQDYKFLRAAVMICAVLVNTQTDRHIDGQLLIGHILLAQHCSMYTQTGCSTS